MSSQLKRGAFWTLLAVVLAVSAYLLCDRRGGEVATNSNSATVDLRTIDSGTVTTREVVVPIDFEEAVTARVLTASCSCLRTTLDEITILPGQPVRLQLSLRVKHNQIGRIRESMVLGLTRKDGTESILRVYFEADAVEPEYEVFLDPAHHTVKGARTVSSTIKIREYFGAHVPRKAIHASSTEVALAPEWVPTKHLKAVRIGPITDARVELGRRISRDDITLRRSGRMTLSIELQDVPSNRLQLRIPIVIRNDYLPASEFQERQVTFSVVGG